VREAALAQADASGFARVSPAPDGVEAA
jgi:hypothetical protein